MWDKDEKRFVDKASKTEGGDGIEEEITIGVENVKANVTASTTKAPVAETANAEVEKEEDELPF